MWSLRREIEALIFIALATGISLFTLTQYNKRPVHIFIPSIPAFPTAAPTPASVPPIQTSSLDSPDGTETLIMKKKQIGTTWQYSFYVSTQKDPSQKLVLSKTTDLSQNITIPLNAWDPNNQYIFVKDSSPSQTHFFVFSSLGTPVSGNTPDVDVSDKFKDKLPDYTLSDVTGWAAPSLLIVNAKNKDVALQSFWFDIQSQSFIFLATKFY